MQLHTGTRYASEHILRPEHYQIALDRGCLSGEFRWDQFLFFSEGAHIRTPPDVNVPKVHGFFFDPDVLEQNYGAVISQPRLFQFLTEVRKENPNIEPTGEAEFQRLIEIYKEVVGAHPWDTVSKSYSLNPIRTFSERAGLNLERYLAYQRVLEGFTIEPEFVVKGQVPISEAIGISDETGIYWINPATRSTDPNRWDLWTVEAEELGGLERGSFAEEGIMQSLLIPGQGTPH